MYPVCHFIDGLILSELGNSSLYFTSAAGLAGHPLLQNASL